ncbi:hypothetical protein CB1_000334021 [Camelus ferus]|nr:hypothetical protein CB1_000334021 [Camelus ferus]
MICASSKDAIEEKLMGIKNELRENRYKETYLFLSLQWWDTPRLHREDTTNGMPVSSALLGTWTAAGAASLMVLKADDAKSSPSFPSGHSSIKGLEAAIMIIYRDLISHDEMFSNIYKILEVEGKTVSRTEGNTDDSLVGGNASAEGARAKAPKAQ